MQKLVAKFGNSDAKQQFIRYVINGIVATTVHFTVLSFSLKVLGFHSAGAANLFAAFFGIFTSFIGSRYFVFRMTRGHILHQSSKFIVLYLIIGCLHGMVLYEWTDKLNYDYRLGFVLATAMQFFISYFGNKILVFNK